MFRRPAAIPQVMSRAGGPKCAQTFAQAPVSCGSEAEELSVSICFPLLPQERQSTPVSITSG
jgi:hypothetical protein